MDTGAASLRAVSSKRDGGSVAENQNTNSMSSKRQRHEVEQSRHTLPATT
jgi:hypothetical protein